MVERKEIALLYQYDDNWIGGSYYIVNIIKALNVLSDEDKPFLKLFHNSETSIQSIVELDYPYIDYFYFNVNFNLYEKIINRLGLIFFGKRLIKKKINFDGIKNLYPLNHFIETSNLKSFYFWIPDFQERYLPHFFSKKEISQRNSFHEYLVKKEYPIIFSSNNALEDFNKFYPNNKNRKEVLRFVSGISSNYSNLNFGDLKQKYGIQQNYFISPNQFWQHKNQSVVIKAAKILKEKGINFLIVFTGKEFDYRNPNYTTDLKKMIVEYNLVDNFCFLGFIDRDEQLLLMKNSIAIVQPSLFEGWSTVVEDTKALNHVIILSDLPLHREQIKENCLFFDPLNENDLANKLEFAINNKLVTTTFNNLELQLRFAKKIISILK